ncbi:MAG: hypothetical protein ABI301_01325, partial [Jatrophihabitantaceae bacterium]
MTGEGVDGAAALAGWLGGLDRASLAHVLAHRPDALLAPEPRSIRELAERLGRPDSLGAALWRLPLPCLQISETIQALGGRATKSDLASLLADGSPTHESDLTGWFQVLTDHAIAWPAGDGVIATPEALGVLFPSPLGLGPALRTLLAEVGVDQLRRVLKTIGVAKPPTRRVDVVEQLLEVFTVAETVRGIVATAPKAISQELFAWADERGADGYDDNPYDDDPDDELEIYARSYDPAAYQRRSAAAEWASERGLVYSRSWSYDWRMPAEIGRALRGPDYRAPFAPEAVPVEVAAVAETELASHASAAVGRFADLVLTVVDRLARSALATLKSGGVGARELAKLAKALGCTDTEVRLGLELLAASGVIERRDGLYGLSEQAEQWRSGLPADRVAALLASWWRLPYAATHSRDGDGKVRPALKPDACVACLIARQNLLETMAELAPSGSAPPGQLAARALWRRPFVHVLVDDRDVPFGSTLAEATMLGVVASGALTPLGRALIAGQGGTVHDLLTAMLP